MADLADYDERWEAQVAEVQARAEAASTEEERAEILVEIQSLERTAPESVGAPGGRRVRPGSPYARPTVEQLRGTTMGTLCVYCEQREGTDRDVDGRCLCGNRGCQKRARELTRRTAA